MPPPGGRRLSRYLSIPSASVALTLTSGSTNTSDGYSEVANGGSPRDEVRTGVIQVGRSPMACTMTYFSVVRNIRLLNCRLATRDGDDIRNWGDAH